MTDDTGHLLEQIHEFHKEFTYHRWYCSCGVVGGKKPTRDAAFADHERHVEEYSQS